MQLFKYYGNEIHEKGPLWGGVNWEIERRVREFCEETETFGKEEFKQLFDIVNNAVQSRFFLDDQDFGWTFGDVDDESAESLKDYRYIRYSKEFCVRFGRIAMASFYFTPVEESMWRRDEEDMDESRRPRGRMLREGRRPIQRVEWEDFNKFRNDEKYLPNRGEGETMASQLAVAECRIIGRYFKDGETINRATGTPQGNMWSYADWIEENIPELSDLMASFPKNAGPKYELFLYKLAEETDRIIDRYADKPKVGSVYPSSMYR